MMTNFHLMRKKSSSHKATFALTLHSVGPLVDHLLVPIKRSEISAFIQILGKPIASMLSQNLSLNLIETLIIIHQIQRVSLSQNLVCIVILGILILTQTLNQTLSIFHQNLNMILNLKPGWKWTLHEGSESEFDSDAEPNKDLKQKFSKFNSRSSF